MSDATENSRDLSGYEMTTIDSADLTPRYTPELAGDLAWSALTHYCADHDIELGNDPEFDELYAKFTKHYAALARRSGWLGYMSVGLLSQLLETGLVHIEPDTDPLDAIMVLTELARSHLFAVCALLGTEVRDLPTDTEFYDPENSDARSFRMAILDLRKHSSE